MDRFEKNVKQFFRNKRKNFRTVAQECELLLAEKNENKIHPIVKNIYGKKVSQ